MQALEILDEVGDKVKVKFSRMPVPQFSENDDDFVSRWAWMHDDDDSDDDDDDDYDDDDDDDDCYGID